MNEEDKIQLILDWAEDHSRFDPTFVESLAERLETEGSLTERQIESLDQIIEKFRIE